MLAARINQVEPAICDRPAEGRTSVKVRVDLRKNPSFDRFRLVSEVARHRSPAIAWNIPGVLPRHLGVRLDSIDRCTNPERSIFACVVADEKYRLPRQIEAILMHLHHALFRREALKQRIGPTRARQPERRVTDFQSAEPIDPLPKGACDWLCAEA